VSTKERASETVGPKSLNVLIRKKENDRIERENQAFAKRLFAKQKEGSLSKKKMDDDFVNYMKYKKLLGNAAQVKLKARFSDDLAVIAKGSYPTFVLSDNNKGIKAWNNDSFGVMAMDEVCGGF
jgi:hypothetical protein